MRVAILLAGHLRLGDLLDQLARAPGHHPRVDDQGVDPLLELVDVGAQLGRERSEAVGGAVLEEHLLDLVEALEPWILDAAVEVLLAEVDGLVQVREELGDRFDPLPRDAGRRVERLRPRDIATLDRSRERPDLRDKIGHLFVDVGRVVVAHGVQLGLVDDRVRGQRRRGAAGHGERAVGRLGVAADHLVGAAIDSGRHVHDEARHDVLDLIDDAHVGQDDLELTGLRAGIGDDEGDRPGRDRDRARGASRIR